MNMPRLPLELIHEIIQISPRDVQLSLCQSSKQFNLLATESLYREVALSGARRIVACCKTLATNTVAARAVRSFSFDYIPGNYFASFYSVLAAAATSLSNVNDIDIQAPDILLYDILRSFSFPQLANFTTVLPLWPPLVAFLDRHPCIRILTLIPNRFDVALHLHGPAASFLPNLQAFVGSNSDFYVVIQEKRPLQQIILHWLPELPQLEVERIFANLEKCSSSLNLLQFLHFRDWDIGLLDAISMRLPNIVALRFTHGFIGSLQHIDPARLPAMEQSLSRFKALKKFEIAGRSVLVDHHVDTSHFSDEWRIVKSLGSACNTLDLCKVNSDVTWARMRGDNWWPDEIGYIIQLMHTLSHSALEQYIEATEWRLNQVDINRTQTQFVVRYLTEIMRDKQALGMLEADGGTE